jgi:hypothetical protein
VGAPDFGALNTSLTTILFIDGEKTEIFSPSIVDRLDAGDVRTANQDRQCGYRRIM